MDDKNSKKLQEYIQALYTNESINSTEKYLISFSVDRDGVVDIQMDWPEEIDEVILENIASLLFSINSGDMQSMIAKGLQNSGLKEIELTEAVSLVIETWLEFERLSKPQPCVKPRNTLHKGE